MVLLRRPPKMTALIGTPSPFSKSGSITGLLRTGAVNRLFGCAAFSFELGVQSFPCQSITCLVGGPSLPSHQTSPSSVSATSVRSDCCAIHRVTFRAAFHVGRGTCAQ